MNSKSYPIKFHGIALFQVLNQHQMCFESSLLFESCLHSVVAAIKKRCGVMNFAAKKKKSSNSCQRRVLAWIHKRLSTGLLLEDPGLQSLATEVTCTLPECVPIETLIILIGSSTDMGKGWRWTDKILKPIEEVLEEDVLQMDLPATMKEEVPNEPRSIGESNAVTDKDAQTVVDKSKSDFNDDVATAAPANIAATKSKNRGGKTGPKSVFSVNTAPSEEADVIGGKHSGVRPRGCPCCDPDQLDNILDSMMSLNI